MESANPEQQTIITKILNSKQHFFITGSAGTGKTFILNLIAEKISEDYEVAITAMTGIAATSIGGTTLHSFAGFGFDGKKEPSYLAKKRWYKTDVLIIDEVSMLTKDLIEKLYTYVVKYSIRLILFGDLLQLPPVKGDFCFESSVWDKMNLRKNTIILNTIVRQKNKQFANILNEIRIGEISEESLNYLKRFDNENNTIDEKSTKIYAINKNVNNENKRILDKLKGDIVEFECKDIITSNDTKMSNELFIKQPFMKKLLENEAPTVLKLKIGAEVMLTKNSKDNNKLVNGSRGTLLEINTDHLVVRFRLIDSEENVVIQPYMYVVEYGKYKLAREQYPLKLAWSMTVHKSQGMTLKNVLFNTDGSFECGQIYTGMSRVSEPDGLVVDDIDHLISSNKVNKKALNYYKSFDQKNTVVV